jgi:hypothetical protein
LHLKQVSAYLPIVTMQVRRRLQERAAPVLAISGIQEIVQRTRDLDRKAKAVVIVEVQVTDLVVAATVVAATVVAQVIARKAIALAAVLAQALVLREIIAAAPDIARKAMLTVRDVLMDHRHHLIHHLVAQANRATAVRARAQTALLVRDVSAAKAQAVGVIKPDAPIVVAPNLVVAREVPEHSIVRVRRARAEVREAEPVPVARSLVLALVHQVRHRDHLAHLAHHQAVVNAVHTAAGQLVVARLVPEDPLVLADHLVPADREVVVERSQAVVHSRVVAAHVVNRVQAVPVDPELVVGRLAAVVHAQAVAAQENQELVVLPLVDLPMEESLSLVALVVHRAAVAMIEAVSPSLKP